MATSKVYQGFVPTLSTDYTEYITLDQNVDIVTFRLEQVDRNIWAITLAGGTQDSNKIPPHLRTTIGRYDLTKLPPLTGYIPGFTTITNTQTPQYPIYLFFTATGEVQVANFTDQYITVFSGNGMMYRRLA